MRCNLIVLRFLLCLLAPISALSQFTYSVDQSIPVEMNSVALPNPWAGGLNSAQVNTMDLNADGQDDLVIFDKAASKISTFLAVNKTYRYAPEYEVLFPADLNTFVALRDFNCDGKKDIFTFGQIGIFVYRNVTQPGKSLTWKKLSFYNSESGFYSEVLLTKGFSKVNLLPGTNDLPNFVDMDGDGDLDVLNMKFVAPSQAEYHKNFSMERYGTCDSLELERQTQSWGGFLECSCGKIAFNGQTCAQIGGRIEHTGGKALLTLDMDNDGDQDLLFSEETCSRLYYMENQGDANVAVMNNFSLFPASNPVGISLFPSPYLEDVDFDGKKDLLSSPNLNDRNELSNDFQQSLWLHKNTGTNQVPVFTYVKSNFLQADMIDEGDLSAPAFTDFDQDGDEDMFIGRYIGLGLRGTISYFQNNGTPSTPSFTLVTDDFLGLSIINLVNIKPQFVDVDRNGGIDLVFTATNPQNNRTSLYYILSKSATSPSFGGQQIQLASLTLSTSENVTMTDIDLDGRPDLLIGRSTGSLEYWRNSGSGVSFGLVNDHYLGLGPSPYRQNITAVTGDLDADGHDDMAIGDQSGQLSVYGDFRNAGSIPQPFIGLIYDSFSKSYTPRNLGGSLRPVIVHLMAKDQPEMVVGNRLGGLYVLKNDHGTAMSEQLEVALFPNPLKAGQPISIKSDRNVTMDLYTSLGQHIGTSLFIPADQIISYPLQGLAPGIYIARFTAGSKTLAKRFIIL